MTNSLSFLFVLTAILFNQSPLSGDGSFVTVLGHKWTKSHISLKKAEASGIQPVRAVIPANKNFQRNVRVNDPVGARDPNADTIDGRSAEMERMVQESRTPAGELNGFTYSVKLRNDSNKAIEIVFWEYQFTETTDPSNVARRQFLCGVNIRPGKDKELEGFSLSGPSDVVSVSTLADKSPKDFQDQVVINRVEYSDGSMWQRKGWSLSEVKVTYERITKEPWTPGMCKGL